MDGTRTSDYDFDLPVDLIAQQPTVRRGDSRLMVVNRATGEIAHHRAQLGVYLRMLEVAVPWSYGGSADEQPGR